MFHHAPQTKPPLLPVTQLLSLGLPSTTPFLMVQTSHCQTKPLPNIPCSSTWRIPPHDANSQHRITISSLCHHSQPLSHLPPCPYTMSDRLHLSRQEQLLVEKNQARKRRQAVMRYRPIPEPLGRLCMYSCGTKAKRPQDNLTMEGKILGAKKKVSIKV